MYIPSIYLPTDLPGRRGVDWDNADSLHVYRLMPRAPSSPNEEAQKENLGQKGEQVRGKRDRGR